MYLEHFGMKELPFSLSPNTNFVCNLPGQQAALNVLLFSLRSGEGLIKIIGEVGTGKTLLCRRLMNQLDPHFVIAYIPTPDLSPSGLRVAVARELGLTVNEGMNDHTVIQMITDKLIELKAQGKNAVLLIDEAQALPDDSLEALRLLTNIETESEKLLQIVLFAQPELDQRLNTHRFRQLKQRIAFSHYLQQLDRRELESYLYHRLMTAGHPNAYNLFSKQACDLLYRYSQGIPRVINMLSHKALLAAYGRGETHIDQRSMLDAVKDSSNGISALLQDPQIQKMMALGLGIGAAFIILITLYVKL